MRSILSRGIFAVALSVLTASGADMSLGTWKLNVEKSKYTPAPFPLKAVTMVREASDGGVKVTVTGERADGTPINTSYTSKYDGAASPLTGSGLPFDSISIKRVNADTFTDERKKTGGPYHVSGRTVISNGGKMMTNTLTGTDPNGKPLRATLIYEKK